MDFSLNFQSGLGLAQQIIAQVKSALQSGSLRPGEQLPTARALASKLGVNFNTVARAYRQLDREGYVSTQLGRGTYALEVLPKPDKEKSRKLRKKSAAFISEMNGLGYSQEEILSAVHAALHKKTRKKGKGRAK